MVGATNFRSCAKQISGKGGGSMLINFVRIPNKRELSGRVWSANYRARKKGLKGTLTVEDIEKQYRDQKGLCQDCDKLLYPNTDLKFEIDHLNSVHHKGDNQRNNIRILCQHCNRTKSYKTVQDVAKDCAKRGIVHIYADTVPELAVQLSLGLNLAA
jgi:hypothetical protein